jgi:hypothetical protein
MQRWIVFGVLAMILVVGGGGFGYWTYRQNRPSPMWVPLLINRELAEDKRREIAKDLKEKLNKPEILNKVSSDLHLAEKWHLSTDESAAREIAKRLFVRVGEADSPEGRVPSINIGVEGTRRDIVVSGDIALRLMKDVWKILGIKPPGEN